MKMKVTYEKMQRGKFQVIAEVCRELSYSIINDADMLKQYNYLDISQRIEIRKKVQDIEAKDRIDKLDISDMPDSELLLRVVDIHIISGRFNIDPAVVCLITALDANKNYFLV